MARTGARRRNFTSGAREGGADLSLFVKGELARALYARGEYERAETEFIELVAAAAGDNRAVAPALKELGQAQAKAHKSRGGPRDAEEGALCRWSRGRSAYGDLPDHRGRSHRADQQLPVLIKTTSKPSTRETLGAWLSLVASMKRRATLERPSPRIARRSRFLQGRSISA